MLHFLLQFSFKEAELKIFQPGYYQAEIHHMMVTHTGIDAVINSIRKKNEMEAQF